MYRPSRLVALTIIATLSAVGCIAGPTSQEGSSSPAETPTPTTPVSESVPEQVSQTSRESTTGVLTRLSAGSQLGVTTFSPPNPGTEEQVALRRSEALQAGSNISRVLVDWYEVEPTRGVYDLDLIEDGLAQAEAEGTQPMVTIAVIGDTEQFVGDWDDTASVIARYKQLLDQVVPILTEHDVWALSIANEPEIAIDDGFITAAEFNDFAAHVVSYVHELDPELPVTATMTAAGVLAHNQDTQQLFDSLDLVMLNHYCLHPDLTAVDLDEAEGRFDTLVDAAGGKPLVFQELGCPASTLMGSSEAHQDAWFDYATERVSSDPNIRAAFVFELLDWSPELTRSLYASLINEPGLDPAFIARFEAWLEFTGLLRYHDGSARPAWATFLAAVADGGS